MKTMTWVLAISLLGCGGDKAPAGAPAAGDTAPATLDRTGVIAPDTVGEPTPTPAPIEPAPKPSDPPAPTTTIKNVGFAQVTAVFESRGCVNCHSGNGIGKDLGDLTLDGGDPLIFREIAEELSPTYRSSRVMVKSPEASLLLTVPSLKNAPDKHPVTVFDTTADRDYQLLLIWIQEGARSN